MKTLQAKNYKTRKDLDKDCKGIIYKEEYEIQGTKEELAKLSLKDGLFVYGIKSNEIN